MDEKQERAHSPSPGKGQIGALGDRHALCFDLGGSFYF
jgi:hypothetical protein